MKTDRFGIGPDGAQIENSFIACLRCFQRPLTALGLILNAR